jgi:hypothetical protein
LLVAVMIAVAAVSWPASRPVVPDAEPGDRPYRWNRDSLWTALESGFAARRSEGCADQRLTSDAAQAIDGTLARLRATPMQADDPALDSLEGAFFALAPRVATCGDQAGDYVALQGRLREAIKSQSTRWDLTDRAVRDRLYQSLYGSRAAVEEVMLQQDSVNPLYVGEEVPSQTPSAVSNGVRLHSGDILVSRGGYPTSALIARGSDFPGNFSHIAFVHVDSATGAIAVVEAHIERGVAIATADEYLSDKKRRVMLLRLRPDVPALQRDPMLPHRAATSMLARARREHIPYDFTMDYQDASRLFCSEVASAAYRDHGITLWTGISTISSPGLRRWLASFGVRHFETQEPSDLEYDPQLSVVAEWRDATSLMDDHIDNAVTDAMLEGAERGDALSYDWYSLPVARVLKGYSVVREWFGGSGPIPQGMAPSSALHNRSYNARHAAIGARVRAAAAEWTARQGYRPPYWVLVQLAREAMGRDERSADQRALRATRAASAPHTSTSRTPSPTPSPPRA